MDKVKQAGRFVWEYRFWFALGLVAILSVSIYSTGSRSLMAKTRSQKSKLDQLYTRVQGYSRGAQHPNQNWISAAEQKNTQLQQSFEKLWTEEYKKQQQFMTWPSEVQQAFGGRPFGASLTDQQNRLLLLYRRQFPEQVAQIYDELDPIGMFDDREVYGVVDSPAEVIKSAVWDRNPKSMEAWLAQEELWIERAVVQAIARANGDAAKTLPKGEKQSWNTAAVRKLLFIGIGEVGLDTKTLSTNPQLIDGLASEDAPPADFNPEQLRRLPFGARTENRSSQNINPKRYLERTEQYRDVPILVSMLVDQKYIPNVLASLSNMEFSFQIRQVSMGVPAEKVTTPRLLADSRQGAELVQGGPEFDTMQLDVWGVMRFYETPPSMRPQNENENQ